MSDSPIPAFLRAVDALDLEAVMSQFAPAAVLTMPFGEEAVGDQQIRSELRGFIAELRATQHHLTSEWNPEPGVWIAECTATYELTDFSRRGPYKRAIIAHADDDMIERMSIYGAHELPLPEEGHPYTNVRGPHGWLPTL
ncbi:MAG TPA: nuclear transport factor 2 family protein [Solirubrobacteraceae bacterium]|nr:nuclear transport factor 2 family protein [Solirubrobacteraceae bacterium]